MNISGCNSPPHPYGEGPGVGRGRNAIVDAGADRVLEAPSWLAERRRFAPDALGARVYNDSEAP
jgi:hypothetical protein